MLEADGTRHTAGTLHHSAPGSLVFSSADMEREYNGTRL